jgi:hypothetical protein
MIRNITPDEGTLDFVARCYRIERAVSLGDIEGVDAKKPRKNGEWRRPPSPSAESTLPTEYA